MVYQQYTHLDCIKARSRTLELFLLSRTHSVQMMSDDQSRDADKLFPFPQTFNLDDPVDNRKLKSLMPTACCTLKSAF